MFTFSGIRFTFCFDREAAKKAQKDGEAIINKANKEREDAIKRELEETKIRQQAELQKAKEAQETRKHANEIVEQTKEIPTSSNSVESTTAITKQTTTTIDESTAKKFSKFVSAQAISTLITNWESKCAPLIKPDSKEEKEVAMKIKRAVAVPVGALTQRSGEDLKKQINRIVSLIKKQDLPDHPLAGDFTIYEISLRCVKLAEEQLSSNEKAAPAIAVAIIALWLESIQFGELFMAHLYQLCPILIPNSFNENVEEQKLKQMGGMCRLFASLASSDCPPGSHKHPFGIENIWKFLVGTILAPVTELSTQALYEILLFSGQRLHLLYKQQFIKLLKLVSQSFLPKASGGPATRLRILLEDADKNGFKNPPGAISHRFWETKDLYTGKVAGD